MFELSAAAFFSRPLLLPVLVFLMLKVTFKHGLCELSPVAFSGYGAVLVSPPNDDFDGGYRLGKIALTIMERLNSAKVRS